MAAIFKEKLAKGKEKYAALKSQFRELVETSAAMEGALKEAETQRESEQQELRELIKAKEQLESSLDMT